MNSIAMIPNVKEFFDPRTGSISYVVFGDGPGCAVIDPVLGYDRDSGVFDSDIARQIIQFLDNENLSPEWILETHVHADHLTAACYLRSVVGGKIGIGQQVTELQKYFAKKLDLAPEFFSKRSQFDHYFSGGEPFHIGGLSAEALHTPGHTPADVSYLIGDALFCGDTLFMPDVGTARSDFPGGDPAQLFQSIERLLALPSTTRMYVCHDYPPESRSPRFLTSVGEQIASNVHCSAASTEYAFVTLRTQRDATLKPPSLLWQSLQFNLSGGVAPSFNSSSDSYFRLPFRVTEEYEMLRPSV